MAHLLRPLGPGLLPQGDVLPAHFFAQDKAPPLSRQPSKEIGKTDLNKQRQEDRLKGHNQDMLH